MSSVHTLLAFYAVQKYLIRDEQVQLEIGRSFPKEASHILDLLADVKDPDISVVDVSTLLLDLLHNEARLYKRYSARGSYGIYRIDIRGLGGVYYYLAPDFGPAGYFLSVDHASRAIIDSWPDNLVSTTGRIYRKPFVEKVSASNSEGGEWPQVDLKSD